MALQVWGQSLSSVSWRHVSYQVPSPAVCWVWMPVCLPEWVRPVWDSFGVTVSLLELAGVILVMECSQLGDFSVHAEVRCCRHKSVFHCLHGNHRPVSVEYSPDIYCWAYVRPGVSVYKFLLSSPRHLLLMFIWDSFQLIWMWTGSSEVWGCLLARLSPYPVWLIRLALRSLAKLLVHPWLRGLLIHPWLRGAISASRDGGGLPPPTA